jgi:ABC-2 type transport system permease protein
MKAVATIAWREMRAFFLSPMAYVVLTAWLLWSGISFYLLAQYFAAQLASSPTDNPLSAFFGGTTLFFMPLLVFVPVLTMRLIAEERRSGTIEPLLTAPVGEGSIVMGKYLAAMSFWIAMWVPTTLYVWLTSRYGDVDLGTVGASYLGIFGIGLYYMAIGLLMSAVARNQIVAAVLTFLALGMLFALGLGEFVFPDEERRQLFGYLSIWGHMEAFAKGIVDTRYLVFDLTITVLALTWAILVLRARRWAA